MNKSIMHKKPIVYELEGNDELCEPMELSAIRRLIPIACACWAQNDNGTHTYHMFEQPFVPYDVHVVGDIDYFYED